MDSSTWMPALAALLGTGLGALLTGQSQRRSTIDSQVRQARISAYSDYVRALQSFRQLAITRWRQASQETGTRRSSGQEFADNYYSTKADLLAQQSRAVLLASTKDLRGHIEKCTELALSLGSVDAKEEFRIVIAALETELSSALHLASREVTNK